MKKNLLKLLIGIVALILVLIGLFVSSVAWGKNSKMSINPELQKELKSYCKQHGLGEEYCLVVDFSIYSGKDRFFLIDLTNNVIDCSSLCAHGIGKDFDCIVKPKFSNKVGSNLSSLGYYKLGISRKTRQYNLNAIELHGLSPTNSNAYQRGILIHDGLPSKPIIGFPCLPLSQGCFTIPNYMLVHILELKSDYHKPILLYATDSSIFE